MPIPEVHCFYSKNGLEITFELHHKTANPKCPAMIFPVVSRCPCIQSWALAVIFSFHMIKNVFFALSIE